MNYVSQWALLWNSTILVITATWTIAVSHPSAKAFLQTADICPPDISAAIPYVQAQRFRTLTKTSVEDPQGTQRGKREGGREWKEKKREEREIWGRMSEREKRERVREWKDKVKEERGCRVRQKRERRAQSRSPHFGCLTGRGTASETLDSLHKTT